MTEPDPDGVAFYRDVIATAGNRLEPHVSLFPFHARMVWEEQDGQRGWERPDMTHWRRYVRRSLSYWAG